MSAARRPSVGLDFGTSTTLVASTRGVIPIGTSTAAWMPSLVGFDEDVAEDFAADAEHGVVEDAFLGGLADVAGKADDEHDVDGGLVIADDDGGFGERAREAPAAASA